jgi:hypothetical protein
MYSETLVTPHVEKLKPNEAQVSLFEAINLAQIKTDLEHIDLTNPEALTEARVVAADRIAREVNRALWFPVKNPSQRTNDFVKYQISEPPTPDSIRDKQVTDCYGYTLILSELLEYSGIPHRIGYAANHAFTLVEGHDDSHPALWYVDALFPQLNQNILHNTTIPANAKESISSQIAQYGRAGYKLYAKPFINNAGYSFEQFVTDHGWPLIRKGDYQKLLRDNRDDSFFESFYDQHLILSIFDYEDGRKALESEAYYNHAIAHGDFEAAFEYLLAIGDKIPEIDVRSDKHTSITKLVTYYAKQQDQEKTLRAIAEYFSAFDVSNHPSIAILKGDHLRRVGKIGGNPEYVLAALKLYEQVYKRHRVASVLGKIKVASVLYKDLLANES